MNRKYGIPLLSAIDIVLQMCLAFLPAKDDEYIYKGEKFDEAKDLCQRESRSK